MTAPNIPPVKVDILAGQDTATPALKRTGTEIAKVGAGATGGLSPMQRLGKALTVADAREGSVALRAFRSSLDQALSSATGASAGIARLGQGILAVTGGSGVAIAGVAVLALAGAAYRGLTQDARDLEEQHKKTAAAIDEFNKKTAGTAGQIRARLSGQGGEQPSFGRILAGEFGIGSGGAHVGEGLNEQLANQMAAARELQRQITEHEQAHDLGEGLVILKANLKAVQGQATDTAREISGLNAALKRTTDDEEARARGEVTAQQAHLATVTATRDATRATQEATTVEQLYARGIYDLKSPEALDAFEQLKQGWEGVSAAARKASSDAREHLELLKEQAPAAARLAEGRVLSGAVDATGAPIGTADTVSRILGDQGLVDASQASAAFRNPRLHIGETIARNVFGAPTDTTEQAVGILAGGGGTEGAKEDTASIQQKRVAVATGQSDNKAADKADQAMGKTVGELFAHMAAAATSGGNRAGQIMAQAVATVFNQAIQSITSKMGGGFGAGLLGGLGGILSGVLSSLFTNNLVHVMIDGYDSRALSQQQQLMVALTGRKAVSVDILSAGGDVNAILNQLGRQGRTDGTMRVPPGGR